MIVHKNVLLYLDLLSTSCTHPSLKSPFLDCEPVDAEVDYQVVQEEEFDEQASTEEEGVYYLEFNEQFSVDP
jgi:hypothetical protein